ncbi:unnamed protein product [Rotaria magnacalcarata]|uniref:Uncharacterized protein n=1 Tax=Rotaria magnacalcarata TaxID=392030 RepID=A0A815XB84_9BILA|nr:unnamed protein product [Rotaria magnacalcarata]CAF1605750.1 unnamed protein product [Rotaria magnacalcarata]CAF1945120.1 unnamed protein product [Rotaria magnacalcarata]CAF2069245.1 unnamed protein product [Rotaria magnacalcarata]CAF2146968.1 unnamed protein product [Rotaria magnacalcarata]
MIFTKLNSGFLSQINQSSSLLNYKQKDLSYGQIVRSYRDKSFSRFQIIEICFLVLTLLEHGLVFILTFKKEPSRKRRIQQHQRSIILPPKSCLYSCLHRNWMRAFSFSNICLSCVYFVMLMLKHYHPNLVHHSSITFYSLPLNLLQQILINFSTFHLFIIAISVFQYFLRYYRLVKNIYSSYFFNGQNLLLTKHTNVALILASSLALIFAYNFIFYTPKSPQTISLLPLITFNMILLPLIDLIIFLLIFMCLMINYFYKFNSEDLLLDNEQESLRLLIEKNTCIKCYSNILEKNPNLFQDKNYSYRNLYKIFFSARLRSSYSFQIPKQYNSNRKRESSESDCSNEHERNLENNSTNNSFFTTVLIKLSHQHSLCHLSHYLLLIFLFKYVLLIFPQHILQMLFHIKQFHQFILKHNLAINFTYSLYQDNEVLITICNYLFLLSRFGDSLLLIRLPYLVKKYFPCWCHFNSRLLHKKPTLHQTLTMKNSSSSYTEPICAQNLPNVNDSSNELKPKLSVKRSDCKSKHQRFRLQFQCMPLWSHARPKLFQEHV